MNLNKVEIMILKITLDCSMDLDHDLRHIVKIESENDNPSERILRYTGSSLESNKFTGT